MAKYCTECGTELIMKELEDEGMVPFCPSCNQFRFPAFNVAISNIVINKSNGKVLLIQQYGRGRNVLVAGYVTRGEEMEHAAVRELKEETNLTPESIHFNRTCFYEPSNTLMCNFTVFVKDDSELNCNKEIDSYAWFTPEEARKVIAPGGPAEKFINMYFDEHNL